MNKIPKGAKSTNLPVEQPTKLELVNGKADRPHDPAERAGACGQGDQVRVGASDERRLSSGKD
jgi:hypothetical protein